jgi:hypothetical protein
MANATPHASPRLRRGPFDVDAQRAKTGILAAVDWDDLYGVFFDLQQRLFMVQVLPLQGDNMPVLTVFGRLTGGPNRDIGNSDTITLSLAADQGGANGAIMIQKRQFEGADQPRPSDLRIRYAGLELLFTAQSEPEDKAE